MGQPQASEYNQHTAVSSTGNTAQGSSQDSRHEICIALGGKQLSKTVSTAVNCIDTKLICKTFDTDDFLFFFSSLCCGFGDPTIHCS